MISRVIILFIIGESMYKKKIYFIIWEHYKDDWRPIKINESLAVLKQTFELSHGVGLLDHTAYRVTTEELTLPCTFKELIKQMDEESNKEKICTCKQDKCTCRGEDA